MPGRGPAAGSNGNPTQTENDAMNSSADIPGDDAQPAVPAPEETKKCARCGHVVSVDDDGFCGDCSKVMEQACL